MISKLYNIDFDCILVTYGVKCLVTYPITVWAIWWANEMHLHVCP